jgi:hypothetical protein
VPTQRNANRFALRDAIAEQVCAGQKKSLSYFFPLARLALAAMRRPPAPFPRPNGATAHIRLSVGELPWAAVPRIGSPCRIFSRATERTVAKRDRDSNTGLHPASIGQRPQHRVSIVRISSPNRSARNQNFTESADLRALAVMAGW